jgi:hypothetical protein
MARRASESRLTRIRGRLLVDASSLLRAQDGIIVPPGLFTLA